MSEWKWKSVIMGFMVGLHRTQRGYDSVWGIVDRLTKLTNFIPVKTTYLVAQYAQLYIENIVSLHGVLVLIMSDGGP